MKANYSLAPILIAALTDTYEREIKDIYEAERVEIKIKWAGLEGTLNAKVEVFERASPSGTYDLWDTTDSVKVLSAAAGVYSFKWPYWNGNDIKIVVTKNGCTAGTITGEIGIQ